MLFFVLNSNSVRDALLNPCSQQAKVKLRRNSVRYIARPQLNSRLAVKKLDKYTGRRRVTRKYNWSSFSFVLCGGARITGFLDGSLRSASSVVSSSGDRPIDNPAHPTNLWANPQPTNFINHDPTYSQAEPLLSQKPPPIPFIYLRASACITSCATQKFAPLEVICSLLAGV